jgi:FkbM family methyltransferase
MYKNKQIIQIGSHIGNTINDPIFREIDENTKIILVEPVPYLFEFLQYNYYSKLKDTSNIIFINKAVSDFVGEIELTIPSLENDFRMLPDWASQLASVNPYHATAKQHIPDLIVETITVPTTTLDEIVKEYNIQDLYFLQIDTEGHDYTILMNYSFTIKPQILQFEHKHMDGVYKTGEKYFELTNRLLSLGYKLTRQDTEDSVFEL